MTVTNKPDAKARTRRAPNSGWDCPLPVSVLSGGWSLPQKRDAETKASAGTRKTQASRRARQEGAEPMAGWVGNRNCLSAGRSTGGKLSGQIRANHEPTGARPSTGDGGGEPNGRQKTDIAKRTSSARATTADAELLAADDNRQHKRLLRVRLVAKTQSGSRECLPRRVSECEWRRGGRQDEGSYPTSAAILCASRST